MSQFIVFRRKEAGYMERCTELLYWFKYREHIHGYLQDRDSIMFDEECPERAIKSFWAWFEQKDT